MRSRSENEHLIKLERRLSAARKICNGVPLYAHGTQDHRSQRAAHLRPCANRKLDGWSSGRLETRALPINRLRMRLPNRCAGAGTPRMRARPIDYAGTYTFSAESCQCASPGDVMVPWNEPEVKPVAISNKRSTVKLPFAPANRPVPPVTVLISTMRANLPCGWRLRSFPASSRQACSAAPDRG